MKHAMILAAGRGERMRPLTDNCPKPLLPVAGKPLIVWHIEKLVAAGITDITINHAWLGEKIEATLGSGQQWGVRLHYSPEHPALETAGGIKKALSYLGNEAFIVINGDVWCDWNLQAVDKIQNQLIEGDLDAWLLLVPNPEHNPQGDFSLHSDGFISSKSSSGDSQTFSGIGIYRPRLFDPVPLNTPTKLAPLLLASMAKKRIIGANHSGTWIDVGTPARLEQVSQILSAKGNHSKEQAQ